MRKKTQSPAGVVWYEGAMVLGFCLTRENKIQLYDSPIDMKCQFYHSTYQTGISIFAGGSTLRVWGPVLWQTTHCKTVITI